MSGVGLGFGALGVEVSGFGAQAWELMSKVYGGLGFRVWGLGFA